MGNLGHCEQARKERGQSVDLGVRDIQRIVRSNEADI